MKRKDRQNRRRHERIPVNEGISFFHSSGQHLGRLLDCSVEGMLIGTHLSLPLNMRLEVVIFTGNELLNIPVRVVGMSEKDGQYRGVGVKVLCTSDKYMQFVVQCALRDVST